MQRFKNILVYAGTDDPETAIARAFEIAKENKAVVTLMDVIKPLPSAIGIMTHEASPDKLEHLLIEDRGQRLVDLANQFCRESLSVEILVRCGSPAQEITKRVLAGGHDLVIKTADGCTTTGRLFGSIARTLLRICPCPLWILKPKVHAAFNQVLAAIDLDADDETHLKLNNDILELAYAVARRDQAKLHLVSVWDMWMEQSLRRRAGDAEVDAALAKREAKVRNRLDRLLQPPFEGGDEIEVHLQRGQAATNILGVADEIEADLVVMGTVCRTGVAGFLIGNTAENLLSAMKCSVLALKPEGFQSPIEINEDDETAESCMLPMT
ncbi:Universal stress protein E [Stieleria maiorica]|uniref:Universal stress protein E n=1 Tax=Stieleria maiorica TaxID=2795974 RepID=A0A5B9MNY8_9BACT|nr:universal stress protein [Stieleria maiorica]QEG01761.1 Universal stress protein E [Stieleria maiorica]